jgi:hypothetical protein
VIVLALGSVQMIIVGVMGEYIGRLYMQAKGRPLYVIDEVVASSELVLKPKVTVKDSVS